METRETEQTPEQIIVAEWERAVIPLVAEDIRQAADFFLAQTLSCYEEDGRYYHVLMHIADGIKQLEPYRNRDDYVQLFLAYLWHDVVYDPASQTNEEDSAQAAVEIMNYLALPEPGTVNRLITATKSHMAEQEDEALICAVDLSILGTDEDTYSYYKIGIYEEYSMYDPEAFRQGRAKVLRHLMGDENSVIFSHPDFAHLNEPAKRNMARELAELTV